MKKISLLLVISVLFTLSCSKKDGGGDPIDQEPDLSKYTTGTTIYGTNNHIRFIVGDLESPIMLSSPHDGELDPSSMPRRTHPDAVTVRDTHLTDLTLKIADDIKKKTGLRPHVIINDVERARMEPNRALAEAHHKSEAANSLWKEYHVFLRDARLLITKNVGKGIYFDMHGHGHTKKRIEVGYTVSRAHLNAADDMLDNVPHSSSIYDIAKKSPYSFSQLIRGDYAFGTFLANAGVPAVPSKTDPKPNDDDYFNGGYCTATYGSRSGGTVSAIQLETHGTGFRMTAPDRTASAPKMADAMIGYVKKHYNLYN